MKENIFEFRWVFVVTRENRVEQTKIFNDFWEGCKFVDEFIKNIEPSIQDFPVYQRGEFYNNGEICVGLYKG
jgi:hypothetical protein